MIARPDSIGRFEFAVLASLRATQLSRGCPPRVDGDHNVAVTAQMEVAGGAVSAVAPEPAGAADAAVPAVSEA